MPETLILTTTMAWVFGILAIAVGLFVSEIVRVDVAAVLVLVLLGLLTIVPGLEGLVSAQDLFSGFASNAVISIIAVMIIGAGLDKTGAMTYLAAIILRIGGSTERRIIPLIAGSVGLISSFMQNVGAAALFIPVVSRIAARTHLHLSRLLMPMGFCAILGGTITMVGSSPLILLNDLINTSNAFLPPEEQMPAFGLFEIAPIGLALVVAGIAYFVLFGHWVLPSNQIDDVTEGGKTIDYFKKVYGLDAGIFEVRVPPETPLVGRKVGVIERAAKVRIIAAQVRGEHRIGPNREIQIEPGVVMAVMSGPKNMERFVDNYELELSRDLEEFAEDLIHTQSGIAEVVIPPNSDLIGKTVRDIWMRKTYDLAVLVMHRAEQTIREGIRDIPLQAGDTLVCHTTWDDLARLEKNRNFVVVTSEYPHEELRPKKVGFALGFFALALILVLFSDLKLSISLLVGAMGMVVSQVLSMDEAYEAVSWSTVFLLASLIPLGHAMENSGAAAWVAAQVLSNLEGVSVWVLQAAIALLATVFTLVMSNVGATVLLVPLAVNIAVGVDADPRLFALTVAIAVSNSFLIPTHQVNALIMGPGGYRVVDYLRAGIPMTVIFLVVALVMLNVIF